MRKTVAAPAVNRSGYGCAVCHHEKRTEIDAELVARAALRPLAKRYGMSTASLSRHRSNHLSNGFAVIHPTVAADAPTLKHLEGQAARIEALITKAERDGRPSIELAGSRELRLLREGIARARGESNGQPPTVIDIQRSAEWIAIRTVIYEVLAPHPDLRRRIADGLLALDNTPSARDS